MSSCVVDSRVLIPEKKAEKPWTSGYTPIMASHESSGPVNLEHPIRNAEVADVDQLRQIDVECFGKSAVPMSQMKWLLESQGENPVFFVRVAHVLEQPRQVTGFICWKFKNEQQTPSFEILDLSVGKNFRDERIEDALVQHAVTEATAAGCIGISVNVPQSNIPACAFYLRIGFMIQHSVQKYYDDGTGMDVMVRRLK